MQIVKLLPLPRAGPTLESQTAQLVPIVMLKLKMCSPSISLEGSLLFLSLSTELQSTKRPVCGRFVDTMTSDKCEGRFHTSHPCEGSGPESSFPPRNVWALTAWPLGLGQIHCSSLSQPALSIPAAFQPHPCRNSNTFVCKQTLASVGSDTWTGLSYGAASLGGGPGKQLQERGFFTIHKSPAASE